MSVDLPAPFSPTTAWISPARQSRSTPWSTSTPRKLLRIPRISSSSAMLRPPPIRWTRRGQHRVDELRAAGAVGEGREPVGLARAGDRRVRVGDEQVEAVEVALRVARGRDRVGGGLGAERAGVAPDGLGRVAAAEPERLGALLLEADARVLAGDLDVQVVLAAGRDLADDQRPLGAGRRAEQRGDRVLGGDGPAFPVLRAGGGEGLRVRVRRALGEHGGGLGAERDDPVAGDELDEVAPVRADVRERPRGAAEVGVDAPVVVVGRGEPVLQVAPVDQPDGTERPGADAGARLADDGMEAVDERDGGDATGRARCGDQLAGLRRAHRQRLLADDVLAVGERERGEVRVEMVRRADVEHVDVVGGRQLLGRRVGLLGAEPGRGLARALGGRGDDAGERGAGEQRRPGVDGADEPGPGHPRAQGPLHSSAHHCVRLCGRG